MKRLWAILGGHTCWPGVPHKNDAGEIVMICYSCGKTRRVKADLGVAP